MQLLTIGEEKAKIEFVAIFAAKNSAATGKGITTGVSRVGDQEISSDDGLVVRSSGSWAEEKLYYLRCYLDIFSMGMKKKWGGSLYYVDLFAGPGRCRIRGPEKEVDGSPLVAVTQFDFANYYLFESDPAAFHALKERLQTRAPNKAGNVKTIPGDCNDTIEQANIPREGLGVAFIDPTGISQIPFETMRKLTTGRQIDLIINFPEGMGIRMNVHQYTQTDTNALSRFMGSERWKTRYNPSLTSFNQVCSEIGKEYLANLEALGYRSLDSDWIPVRTDQNTLIYYLLYASKHPRGNDFWHKITRIDPHGQRELFS